MAIVLATVISNDVRFVFGKSSQAFSSVTLASIQVESNTSDFRVKLYV